MNEQDYIRKAVELADGIEVTDENRGHDGFWLRLHGYRLEFHSSWPWVRDAIRAQLERQVDALGNVEFDSRYEYAIVWDFRAGSGRKAAEQHSNDRTMNAIRAVVDSGVLDR